MTPEQHRIKLLTQNLLATLDELVPDSTIHYVVENTRRWLQTLAKEADTITTTPASTWTFCGHWEGDSIVIDYSLPGVVADDRRDESGQYSEGLWAAAASGATEEEAAQAAIAEYEKDDDTPVGCGEPHCGWGYVCPDERAARDAYTGHREMTGHDRPLVGDEAWAPR